MNLRDDRIQRIYFCYGWPPPVFSLYVCGSSVHWEEAEVCEANRTLLPCTSNRFYYFF